jgi:hypothetical protein
MMFFAETIETNIDVTSIMIMALNADIDVKTIVLALHTANASEFEIFATASANNQNLEILLSNCSQ